MVVGDSISESSLIEMTLASSEFADSDPPRVSVVGATDFTDVTLLLPAEELFVISNREGIGCICTLPAKSHQLISQIVGIVTILS